MPMKKIYLLSAIGVMLFAGGFSQENASKHAHENNGMNSPEHYRLVEEQHRLVKTYLNHDAFDKMYQVVAEKANVAEKHKASFYNMLKEKYNLKDRQVMIARINSGELSESNIAKYLSEIKPAEYASYYQGAFLKGKSSLLENAPKVTMANNQEMENWLSSRLKAPVGMSLYCGNIDFDLSSFSGWRGNYTAYNCTSPTPNTRTVLNSFNYTAMNTTTDQHGLVNGGNDPSVVTATLPCLSPFGGAPITCRLGDVLDGCGAADLTYSFTVNNNNTNFTYSYAVVVYDGHPASDAPKVTITMRNLTTGANIPCAAYQIDATQGAGGANGYLNADPNNTLMYYKPWSQVYIPLLNFLGQDVEVTVISSDCNGGAHRGYCYIDFTCSPLQLLSSTPMICGNQSSVLTAPPGASSYSWTTTGGNIIGATNGQSVTVNQSGQYQVTLGSFGSGCTLVIDTFIPGGPTAPISSFTANPGCFSMPVPFTDQSNPNGGGAITSWNWTFGDGSGTSTSQNPNYTYASAGTYTVTLNVSNAGGCVSTYTSQVTVTAGVTPTFTASTPCVGAPTTLGSTTTGATTYTWTYNGSSSNGTTATTTYTAAGSYPVTLAVSTGSGCGGTVTQSVTINPLPPVTSTSNTLCAGGAPVPINGGGATTYTWSTGAVSATLSDNPATTTVYTVVGTDANGCMNMATGTITPIANPTVNVAPITICQGLSGTLSATGASTYNWSGPNLSATTGTSVSVNPPTTSTYTIIGTVGTCTASTLVIVTISPPPSIQLTSPPTTCPGQMVPPPTYTVVPNDPNMTYGWTNSNTVVGMGASGTGIPGSFVAATNNTLANLSSVVSVTPTLNGCVGPPGTYTITIYPTPVINPMVNVEQCPNNAVPPTNLSVLPGGGAPNFSWQNSNPSIGLAASGNGSPVPGFTGVNGGNTAQAATILVSASLNGCPAIPVPFNITINPNPIAAFNASYLICVGSPMSFTDLSTVGSGFIAGWAWNLDGAGAPFSAAQNPQLVIQPAGTHSVTLTATTDKGCTNTVTNPVYINYIPVASFLGGGQGCPILTVNNFQDQSTVTGPAVVNSWNWNFGNTAVSNQQNAGVVTYGNGSPIQNVVYTVSLIVSTDSGCVSTSYSNPCVTVFPQPIADFTYGPRDPGADVMSPTIFFFDQSAGATGQNGLLWYLGDVFLNNLQNNYTTVQNPVHTYESYDPYIYYVTQWVQNSYGCKDSITKPVEILPSWTFYIPNAFSPNGDGVNEGFKGTGIGIDNTTYNLWIFDRWGNMIFYSNDLEETWNGRIQGKDGEIVMQDVYVWKVKFSDFTGKKHEYKGTVSVVK